MYISMRRLTAAKTDSFTDLAGNPKARCWQYSDPPEASESKMVNPTVNLIGPREHRLVKCIWVLSVCEGVSETRQILRAQT